jgi:Protein of unknown function (DUF664)
MDERTMLATFLDYARATVHAKCEHLTEADAHRAPLPSSPLMAISGLVSHLRWMEHYWFQVMLGGEEDRGPGPTRASTARCALPSRSRSPAARSVRGKLDADKGYDSAGNRAWLRGVGSRRGWLGVESSRRSGWGGIAGGWSGRCRG